MYQVAQPPTHLKHYIDYFWMGEQTSQGDRCLSHHAVASSKLELQFHYVGQYTTPSLNGQQEPIFQAGFFGQGNTHQHYFSASHQTGIFSVRFHPLALATLFNVSASELTNERADIAAVLGRQGTELAGRIFEETTFSGRIKVVSQFLDAKLKPLSPKYVAVKYAINQIYQSSGRIRIDKLMADVCLSPRQFERNFKELTGFSAKAYLKIVRFERLIETMTAYQPAGSQLIDLALDAGYYDQAHLNRHFKELTGVNPSTYLTNLALSDQY